MESGGPLELPEKPTRVHGGRDKEATRVLQHFTEKYSSEPL